MYSSDISTSPQFKFPSCATVRIRFAPSFASTILTRRCYLNIGKDSITAWHYLKVRQLVAMDRSRQGIRVMPFFCAPPSFSTPALTFSFST